MADVFGIGTIAASGMTNATNGLLTYYNNAKAAEREAIAREENYLYNEKSAYNADARTRALYNDLYSPKAQMQQLKDAGLSPSLFYGDGGGISGQAGAQGAGAAGISPNVFGMPAVDFSQLGLIAAQTEKLKAETNLVKSENKEKDLQNEVTEMAKEQYKTEWNIVNAKIVSDNGEETSLFEIAQTSENFEQFNNKVREIAKGSNPELYYDTTSETGQKIMRSIFYANRKLDRDLSVLSNEKVDTEFYESLTRVLQKKGYINLSSDAAIEELKKQTATNKLDERQKSAFNNIIAKLDKSNSTTNDVVIAILLMLNNALTNYHLPSVNIRSNNKMTNIVH